MAERLFSTYQVADLLGATPGTVSEWIQKGMLPSQRIAGGPLRISESGLVRFLKDQGIDIETVMAKAVLREDKPASSQAGRHLELPPVEPSAAEPPSAELELPAGEDAAAQVADAILTDAVDRRASDVHLEPGPDGLSLRLRIDGVLHDKARFRVRLPRTLAPRLIGALKSLAGADAGESRRPQTGRFRRIFAGREVEFELTTCPTLAGERLVLAVRDRQRPAMRLDQLGLTEDQRDQLAAAASAEGGLIVVAGPPRSGKATTLCALLAELGPAGRSIATVERSADGCVEGVSCSQTDAAAGFSFADAMRVFARMDADVIVLGDVPDPPTARAALDAALDGRLVLAGVRAADAVGAVETLLAMGAEPWPLASALRAAVAQRTARTICPQCKQQVQADKDVLRALGVEAGGLEFPVFAGAGCKSCSNCGYLGRTGLFSLLPLSGPVTAAIRDGLGGQALAAAAQQAGMRGLVQAGLEKARDGQTSLAELARVLAGSV